MPTISIALARRFKREKYERSLNNKERRELAIKRLISLQAIKENKRKKRKEKESDYKLINERQLRTRLHNREANKIAKKIRIYNKQILNSQGLKQCN